MKRRNPVGMTWQVIHADSGIGCLRNPGAPRWVARGKEFVWTGAAPGDEVEVLHIDNHGWNYYPRVKVQGQRLTFDSTHPSAAAAKREATQAYAVQVRYLDHLAVKKNPGKTRRNPALSPSWRRPWTPGEGNRVEFNWGYHDGASDVRNGREERDMSTHYSRGYAAGYRAGVRDAKGGLDTSSSEPAWLAAVRAGKIKAGEPPHRASEMTKAPTFKKTKAAWGFEVNPHGRGRR